MVVLDGSEVKERLFLNRLTGALLWLRGRLKALAVGGGLNLRVSHASRFLGLSYQDGCLVDR